MTSFDIRKPWEEGNILIKRIEIFWHKLDLTRDGFSIDDAEVIARLHVSNSSEVVDAAILKMMRG